MKQPTNAAVLACALPLLAVALLCLCALLLAPAPARPQTPAALSPDVAARVQIVAALNKARGGAATPRNTRRRAGLTLDAELTVAAQRRADALASGARVLTTPEYLSRAGLGARVRWNRFLTPTLPAYDHAPTGDEVVAALRATGSGKRALSETRLSEVGVAWSRAVAGEQTPGSGGGAPLAGAADEGVALSNRYYVAVIFAAPLPAKVGTPGGGANGR